MRNSPQLLAAPNNGQRVRKKVALAPGHSPMDWARLKASGQDLRGVGQLRRFTMEEVAQHNKRDDCWMVIYGKVYNVTRYIDFHPGGRGQLMRAAGKDGSKLFSETHAWVNFDMILDQCLVGFV
ncbi:cytochrome b5 reductase [Martensiomyces pterosporus]|nr:cytochrome b5 reductase [Martensiomyces pterosporus]